MRPLVAVVGAGPAGICAVAALVKANVRVAWIDSKHRTSVGRLSKFCNVHSNTKVELVTNWLQGPLLGSFIASSPRAMAATKLIKDNALPLKYARGGVDDQYSPQEHWCTLGDIVRVFELIAQTLHNHPNVTVFDGYVNELHRPLASTPWSVSIDSQTNESCSIVEAGAVVLAVGAEPKTVGVIEALQLNHGNSPRILSAEMAIDRLQLETLVKAGESIALFGTSHTAGLIAMHLRDMECDGRLTVFGLDAVRNAKWESPPGQYRYSASGLKGAAAAFIEHQRNGDVANPTPLLFHKPASSLSVQELQAFDVVIPAVGYATAQLPRIYFQGELVDVDVGVRDANTSQLHIPGCDNSLLLGTGVGWSEYFAQPAHTGAKSNPGFGEPQDVSAGMLGEPYVGVNAMIMRAEVIAKQALWNAVLS
eukprot:m.258238 g.258238  ORF g.258238 m.258238 type:complete len:422 (+) comp36305_c0_seq1:1584-2849(+)